jgi:hypothetical protein
MGKLKAIGKFRNRKTTVEIEVKQNAFSFLFNGNPNNPLMKLQLEELLKEGKPMMGSYLPPEHSMNNAWNVLKYYFFDDPRDVEIEITEGELEEVESEEGVVY